MKKRIYLSALVLGVVVFQYCHSSKKAQTTAKTTVSYEANVKPILAANCTPCHFPPQGNKKPYDTYAAVKGDIGEILERVQKNPGDKGFMPFKHPKLADSTIHVLTQWQSDGLTEK